ncbi:DNA-binding response regulator, partial [Mesorhizobium sp. M8A.F.Ca.ET.023.02.2.1]
MNKVLLIDDDVELTTLLQEYLVEEGYDVVTGTDGGTAIA